MAILQIRPGADRHDKERNRRLLGVMLDAQGGQVRQAADGRTMPGHFDPAVLDAFAKWASHFAEIYAERAD